MRNRSGDLHDRPRADVETIRGQRRERDDAGGIDVERRRPDQDPAFAVDVGHDEPATTLGDPNLLRRHFAVQAADRNRLENLLVEATAEVRPGVHEDGPGLVVAADLPSLSDDRLEGARRHRKRRRDERV